MGLRKRQRMSTLNNARTRLSHRHVYYSRQSASRTYRTKRAIKKPGLLLAGLWRVITLTFCPRRRLVTPEWRFPGFWCVLLSPTLHRLIMSRSVIRHGRIRRSLTSYSGGTAPDLHRLPLPVPEIRDVLRPYSVVKYAWLAKGSVDVS